MLTAAPQGAFEWVISTVVAEEIKQSPITTAKQRFNLALTFGVYLPSYVEVSELQKAYLLEGIVSRERATDALHIALATLDDCDALMSFDTRHGVI